MSAVRRVIFFNPYADRDTKGAARRIELLSVAIRRAGRSVDVVLKEEYASGPHSWMETWAARKGLQRLAYFCAAGRLARQADSVVVSEVIFIPTWRRNVVLTIHDLKAFDGRASRGGRLRAMAYKVFARLACKIVVVSKSVKQDVVRHCGVSPAKVHVNYNGLADERIALAQRSRSSDKRYDFVYVSSFARHKRHAMLVAAAPVGARLCLIGRDLGSLDEVREQIARRGADITVDVFTDIGSDEELFALIGAAGSGIFPSVFEGFGIPLLEYAAAGLYVMAADIAIFREIADYVDCFFPADDEAALQEAMTDFLRHRPVGKPTASDLLRNGEFSEDAVSRAFIDIVDAAV